MILRILLLVVGVVAVMIGAQLPWGEVDAGNFTIPLVFFLDIGAIGSLLSVIGVALGGLSLSERVSDRSVGVLLVIFGFSIAVGCGILMTFINQDNLQVDPGFPVAVESVVLGPGGFVAASGGVVLALAGLAFIVAPLPPGPPLPAGGGPGEVPAGWYPSSRRPDVIAYWNGTRWSHQRHL